LRGLVTYYALALNARREMRKLERLWRVSLFQTLAAKHKTSPTKRAKQLKTKDGYALTVQMKEASRHRRGFRLKDLRPRLPTAPQTDLLPKVSRWTLSRTEGIKRLNSHHGEYGGTRQGPFEVHHSRKLKEVTAGKTWWQRMMAARRR